VPAKRSGPGKSAPVKQLLRAPHYAQTTDFSCGPSSLIMAMKALRSHLRADRSLELQLWREANTIFTGRSGDHGGCSALGLALAAHRRGLAAEVYVNHRGVLLSTRRDSRERAEVMRVLHERDLEEMRAAGIPIRYRGLRLDELAGALRDGALPIVFNSMEYLHHEPTPHWFLEVGVDGDTVYVNDPWVDRSKGKSARDLTAVPIALTAFARVTSYARKRERQAVLVRRHPAR
jgi:predicted double-glycine peptidase